MKLTQDPDTDSREPGSPLSNFPAPHSERKLIKVDLSALSSDEEEDEVLEVTKVVTENDEEKLEIGRNVGTDDGTTSNPWTRTGSLKLSKAEIDHYCDTALQCTAPNYNSLRSRCCIL